MSAPRNVRLSAVRKPKANRRRVRVMRTGRIIGHARGRGEPDVLRDSPIKIQRQSEPSRLPWPIEMVPLRHLKPAARQLRSHPKKQIERLAANMQHFGFTNPPLADEHLNVIAGHARIEAAERTGLTTIPVIIIAGLSEAQKRALALADNKIAELGGWLRPGLAMEVTELAPLLELEGLDLSLTGFESAEIDALKIDLVDPECDPIDELPVIPTRNPVNRSGDLWLLGPHRIMCGDASNADHLQRLMGHDRAAMVFTDPPYNVKIRSIVGRGKTRHREFVEGSGEKTSVQFVEFLAKALGLAVQYSADGSIHFVCMDWRHTRELQTAGEKIYAELKNICVWVKSNAGMGSFYRSQHEFVFVFKNGDRSHQNHFELGQHGRHRSNVWHYAGISAFRRTRMDELSMHPTVKPVAMVVDALRDCSARGDIVLDSFLGSGTTIVAAERVGRRGYGLELDPLYVDVAIRRWQSFTKRDAVLLATGQTFEEVAAARHADAQSETRPRRVRRLK
jgi:DNA modification methylase